MEDFEFKKLLINTVVILSRSPVMNEVKSPCRRILSRKYSSSQLILKSRILLALLSYVEPLPKKKSNLVGTFEWTTSQYEELQLHALVALSILLPALLEEYFQYQVGTRLLMFYEWTINKGK